MKKSITLIVGALIAVTFMPAQVHAESLKIAPLEYRTTLTKGETKKGFVDISNPSGNAEHIHLSVRSFRQTDDQGSLEFYQDEQVASGIVLDYDDAELGPKETLHLAFLIEGSKLPNGNVFGAILAATIPSQTNISNSSVQVGALLSIENGTEKSDTATITSLSAPFFQIGQQLSIMTSIKNTADPKTSTGFYPELRVTTNPYGSTVVKGPLVFAGRTRTIDYRAKEDYLGPLWVTVVSGNSSKSQLVFAITGYWRYVAPIIVLLVGTVIAVRRRLRASFSQDEKH